MIEWPRLVNIIVTLACERDWGRASSAMRINPDVDQGREVRLRVFSWSALRSGDGALGPSDIVDVIRERSS
jgi:hypothetical protein